MAREVLFSSQFRRDLKRVEKRGKDVEAVRTLAKLIASGEPLPVKYRDHALTGNWVKHRECHIEPDWLLIYRLTEDGESVRFERTGTHSDLFR